MARFLSLLRRLAGVVLGLFILGQIFFLLSANVLRQVEDFKPFLKKEVPLAAQVAPDWLGNEGTVHAVLTTIERADRRWGELSGQPQSWSLFAPLVAESIPVPFVELRWDDERLPARSAASLLGTLASGGPLEAAAAGAAAEHVQTAPVPPREILRSDNEPADRHCYFRRGLFRLRCYEDAIDLPAANRRGETADRLRGRIEGALRDDADHLSAYLRWRLAAFQAAHPELPPPRQVIGGATAYHIPPPPGPRPWDWQVPEPQPMVRWLPGSELGPEYFPLEMYNPVVDRFENLRR